MCMYPRSLWGHNTQNDATIVKDKARGEKKTPHFRLWGKMQCNSREWHSADMNTVK